MMQAVLLSAIRGPDGITKETPAKNLLRWYRRCVLISAFDKVAITNPVDPRGGSFTGPSLAACELDELGWWQLGMDKVVTEYLKDCDQYPLHYHLHFLHAVEIVGYKHPYPKIRAWWFSTYKRMVHDMHMLPESETLLDERLGDNEAKWREDDETQ